MALAEAWRKAQPSSFSTFGQPGAYAHAKIAHECGFEAGVVWGIATLRAMLAERHQVANGENESPGSILERGFWLLEKLREQERASLLKPKLCSKLGCANPASGDPVMGGMTYYPCGEHRAEIERLVDEE